MSANRKGAWEFEFPLDLENYERTRDAAQVERGDVIVYVGDNRRRYIKEYERTWLLQVTRTEGNNIYGTNVYARPGWDAMSDEFVVVDGQVEHHGVYVIRRVDAA